MSSHGWSDTPRSARAQVEALLQDLRAAIGSNLSGLYLHGSLAMGCFNPARSDLDLLAVIAEGMPVETRRQVVVAFLGRSRAPHPVEISFLCRRDLWPWRFPTPYDLHYSEDWRARFQADLAGGAWRGWGERELHDPDLAAHITIVRRCGVAISGPPIVDVFPPVPRADYLASILADFAAACDRIVAHPVYGVLSLCRVYWYVLEGWIGSKEEAGVWAAGALPAESRSVVRRALLAYRGASGDEGFAPADLQAFAAMVDERVAALVSGSQRF